MGRVPPLRPLPPPPHPRRGICCPRASASRGRAALGLPDPGRCLSLVPIPSEAICTLNHPPPALSSPTAGAIRFGPISALPRPFPGAAWRGLEKLGAEFPPQGCLPERRVSGWVGRGPGTRLLPQLGGSVEKRRDKGSGKIPGTRGPTGRKEVLWVHYPGVENHSTVNAWVGAGGLHLGPSRPRTDRSLSHLCCSLGIRPARPCSRVRAAPTPAPGEGEQARSAPGGEDPPPAAPHLRPGPRPPPPPLPARPGLGTSGCPLTGFASTCPGRRAWFRRPPLPPPPPSSRAARFPVQQYSEGGTSGERPAELPPGLRQGCGC